MDALFGSDEQKGRANTLNQRAYRLQEIVIVRPCPCLSRHDIVPLPIIAEGQQRNGTEIIITSEYFIPTRD